MERVFFAETTILVHFQSVRIVFLVFCCVIVALLAFAASQSDFYPHDGTSRFTEIFCLPQQHFFSLKLRTKKKTCEEVI